LASPPARHRFFGGTELLDDFHRAFAMPGRREFCQSVAHQAVNNLHGGNAGNFLSPSLVAHSIGGGDFSFHVLRNSAAPWKRSAVLLKLAHILVI